MILKKKTFLAMGMKQCDQTKPMIDTHVSWYYNMTTIILVPNVMQMNRIDMKKLRGLIFEVI
jgi:hypothetical protein